MDENLQQTQQETPEGSLHDVKREARALGEVVDEATARARANLGAAARVGTSQDMNGNILRPHEEVEMRERGLNTVK